MNDGLETACKFINQELAADFFDINQAGCVGLIRVIHRVCGGFHCKRTLKNEFLFSCGVITVVGAGFQLCLFHTEYAGAVIKTCGIAGTQRSHLLILLIAEQCKELADYIFSSCNFVVRKDRIVDENRTCATSCRKARNRSAEFGRSGAVKCTKKGRQLLKLSSMILQIQNNLYSILIILLIDLHCAADLFYCGTDVFQPITMNTLAFLRRKFWVIGIGNAVIQNTVLLS